MNLYEFHPVSLATPLLLFAFVFAHRRRYVPFVICCLAAMGTKEQLGLVVAMFALYVYLFKGERRVGLGLAAIGMAWSLFAALVVEHHYRAPGTLTYLRSRYGYFGHGFHGVLDTVLRHPNRVAAVVFMWSKLAFLRFLFQPAGFLALASPLLLLLAAPSFALDLLSTDSHMYSGVGDNSAELISVVIIASIFGAAQVKRLLERWMPEARSASAVGVYLLAAAILTQALSGYTPLGLDYQVPALGTHQAVTDTFVARIPPSVAVSTQDQLDPHLSSRHLLYLFNDTGRVPKSPAPANYLLMDVSAPTYPLGPSELHSDAIGLLHQRWHVTSARDGLILIEHGKGSTHIPAGFYSYAQADGARPDVTIGATEHGLQVVGYDVDRTDLPNYRIPNQAYTVYLRPRRRIHTDYTPVITELQATIPPQCNRDALGLDWLPTSRWLPGHIYRVRSGRMEVSPDALGDARFFLSLELTASKLPCAASPSSGDKHWKLGSVLVGM